MAEANIDRIKRIIANLRMKTEENGCSESEAMAAAEKLGALLAEHDLTIDETTIGIEAKAASKKVVRSADDYASSIVVGIGRLCDLIVWTSKPGEYSLFGTPADMEVAVYLYEICAFAAEDGFSEYMEKNGYSMKKRASYRMGFAHRINDRLRDLKRERDAAKAANIKTGTDIVLVKDALVKTEFDKLGIQLGRAKRGKTAADPYAYDAGQAHGDRVKFNDGLTGRTSAGMIR